MASQPEAVATTSLRVVAGEWLRIGLIGFGGPPAHVSLLRDLVVRRKGWMDPRAFEDANAASSLLPGPSSTQLSIFCAYRVGGPWGAVIGGLGFVVPAVVMVLALSVLFLASSPPLWVRGAGAGAGAAVAAVAVRAGSELVGPSYLHAVLSHGRRWHWLAYLVTGVAAAITIGPWLVLVLVGCGFAEMIWRTRAADVGAVLWKPMGGVVAAASSGGIGALAWTAFKVGALSFGGGFVVIPLMQGDAVHVYHWLTDAQFLNAVALGQVTPGPVVATVAAIGYGAHGIGGGLLAAVVAFAPSFSFILLGGGRFERLRANERARAFLDGAGPAAIGAILGSAVTLASGLQEAWQGGVLAAAAVALLLVRAPVVPTLLAAGLAGVVIAAAGAPMP
jgi:chromate transporter